MLPLPLSPPPPPPLVRLFACSLVRWQASWLASLQVRRLARRPARQLVRAELVLLRDHSRMSEFMSSVEGRRLYIVQIGAASAVATSSSLPAPSLARVNPAKLKVATTGLPAGSSATLLN